MKKLLLAAAVAAVFVPATAMAGISGTKHDLSGTGLDAQSRICVFCHTPHNGDLTVSDAPLWNHDLTTATFAPYANPNTLDSTPGQPSGISLLCLSCHDNTVSLDAYGANVGTVNMGTQFPGSTAVLGTDLTNDHPISFAYTDALATADQELFFPTTDLSGLGGTIQADMLFSDNLECASCHDVHDNTNTPFLRKANTNSDLCLTCHNK